MSLIFVSRLPIVLLCNLNKYYKTCSLKTTPLKTAKYVKKKTLTKTILRQQLFQSQRWKASQCAFLTHITPWWKAGGGRERKKEGVGGEDLSFIIFSGCVAYT